MEPAQAGKGLEPSGVRTTPGRRRLESNAWTVQWYTWMCRMKKVPGNGPHPVHRHTGFKSGRQSAEPQKVGCGLKVGDGRETRTNKGVRENQANGPTCERTFLQCEEWVSGLGDSTVS